MSPYDTAHDLAKMLGKSEEYKSYQEAKIKLEQDANNLRLLEEFRQLQWEIQIYQMSGQEIEESQLLQLERSYQLLSMSPVINQYLTAEYRFARLMAEIQKIVIDAVPAWFDSRSKQGMVN
jgi:cell fate (sporulation/competence/biofilm development) regulator YlbF (YheA/YmcA/DUF963 family)